MEYYQLVFSTLNQNISIISNSYIARNMKTLLVLIFFSVITLAQEKELKTDSLKVYFKYNLIKSDTVGQHLIDSLKILDSKEPMLGNLYPNPFSPTLEMDLYLPEADSVKMVLYDYDGNIIDYPINTYVMPGLYRLKPNMFLDKSYGLIFQTKFSDTTIVKRMVILK